MRYQKPIVMDLGSRARLATGDPLACISGPTAGGPFESCGTGDTAGWGCDAGNGVGIGALLCVGGSTASGGDCFSGTGVSYYCGVGALGGADSNGCRTGPSFV